MNIFALHNDPKEAARMMCDKHVIKMIIETAQILSCVLDKRYRKDCKSETDTLQPSERLGLPQYPKAHAKHPCTLWAMESKANFNWLRKHLRELCWQYSVRYPNRNGSMKAHSLEWTAMVYDAQADYLEFDKQRRTPFAQAMPVEYKNPEDPVGAYRTYYLMDKTFAQWKRVETPSWYAYGRILMLHTSKSVTQILTRQELAA